MKTEDNPTTSASAIRAPFLILHGEADSVVPVRQSIAFADTLKQHGKQVEIHTEPGAGHDYRFWGAQTQRILGFFAQHFPPTRNSHP